MIIIIIIITIECKVIEGCLVDCRWWMEGGEDGATTSKGEEGKGQANVMHNNLT